MKQILVDLTDDAYRFYQERAKRQADPTKLEELAQDVLEREAREGHVDERFTRAQQEYDRNAALRPCGLHTEASD